MAAYLFQLVCESKSEHLNSAECHYLYYWLHCCSFIDQHRFHSGLQSNKLTRGWCLTRLVLTLDRMFDLAQTYPPKSSRLALKSWLMGTSDQFGLNGILISSLGHELLPVDESSNTSLNELDVPSIQLGPLDRRFLLHLQGEIPLRMPGGICREECLKEKRDTVG